MTMTTWRKIEIGGTLIAFGWYYWSLIPDSPAQRIDYGIACIAVKPIQDQITKMTTFTPATQVPKHGR